MVFQFTSYNDLSEWFKANKLSLNVSKTNYITMQNTNEISINHTLKIGDETIKQVNTAKFLGIIIDDKLSWNAHIDYCKNKLSSGLYAINSAKHILSPKHLKSLYYTLIHPHLTYGLLLWGSTYKTLLKKLQTLQNKSVRSITKSKYNASTGPIYENLGILQISKLYQLEAAKLMFLNKNQHLPSPPRSRNFRRIPQNFFLFFSVEFPRRIGTIFPYSFRRISTEW